MLVFMPVWAKVLVHLKGGWRTLARSPLQGILESGAGSRVPLQPGNLK